MTTYKITPNPNCPFCHGTGTVYDNVPYGSTTASMPGDCNCVDEQLPEEFDCQFDEVEIVILIGNPVVVHGSEFDYDDYLDLWQ